MLLGQGLFLVITMRMLGHTAVLPMPIHAAASKQDKRASCSKSNCKPRRCFTTAAACTCASTPQSYTRLLKTSTSKAFASSASGFVFLTVGCCLCLATHVQVCPGANDEAAAANAIRFKRNGSCEDFMISNLQVCDESVEGGGCRWTPKSAQGHN